MTRVSPCEYSAEPSAVRTNPGSISTGRRSAGGAVVAAAARPRLSEALRPAGLRRAAAAPVPRPPLGRPGRAAARERDSLSEGDRVHRLLDLVDDQVGELGALLAVEALHRRDHARPSAARPAGSGRRTRPSPGRARPRARLRSPRTAGDRGVGVARSARRASIPPRSVCADARRRRRHRSRPGRANSTAECETLDAGRPAAAEPRIPSRRCGSWWSPTYARRRGAAAR